MNYLVKRALILVVFGVIFAGSLIALDLVFSGQPEVISSEPPPAQPTVSTTAPQNPSFSLPPAPAAPARGQQPQEKEATAAAPAPLPAAHVQQDLKKLFSSGIPASEVQVDVRQLTPLLREYIAKNHPSLKLSDKEFERLAETVKAFRQANLRMATLERTSANAPVIRQSLQEMATAMQDFRQITGMMQDEFFLGQDAPVRFGGEGELLPDDEKPAADFLIDHQP